MDRIHVITEDYDHYQNRTVKWRLIGGVILFLFVIIAGYMMIKDMDKNYGTDIVGDIKKGVVDTISPSISNQETASDITDTSGYNENQKALIDNVKTEMKCENANCWFKWEDNNERKITAGGLLTIYKTDALGTKQSEIYKEGSSGIMNYEMSGTAEYQFKSAINTTDWFDNLK